MILLRAFLLFFCLAVLCLRQTAWAADENEIETMLGLARHAQLAAQPEWRKILQYQRTLRGWKSRVDDPSYFLAATGQRDPQAELEATIHQAFSTAEAGNSPQSLRCRFIARYQYLSRQMTALGHSYPVPVCPVFEQWRGNLATQRATLVFAAIHLNSPASMYGHTFIRFDSAKPGAYSRLNDMTVGYSVGSVSQGDPLFLWKSLTGAYPGEFTYAAFFKKVREYSDLENRDMWEYETSLDSDEIRRMQAFIWEQSFTYSHYYFFDDNCSLLLLATLEAGRPSLELIEQSKPWFIPLDSVKVVQSQPGLVTAVRFRPSQFNKTQFNYHRANAALQEDAVALLNEQQHDAVLPRYTGEAARAALLDLTLSMLEYRRNRLHSEQEAAAISQYQFKLAGERSVLKVASSLQEPPPPVLRPDQGHDSFRSGLAQGWLAGDSYQLIELRASNHDPLDPESGYAPGASSTMGDLRLRVQRERLEFERLDLFGVAAPSVHSAWYSHPSIRFNIALAREVLRAGMTPVALDMTAGAGFNWRLGDNGRCYAMADGVVRSGPDAVLAAGPGMGAILAPASGWRMRVETGARWYVYGASRQAVLYRIETDIARDLFNSQNNLRLNLSRQFISGAADDARDYADVRLSYFHYF